MSEHTVTDALTLLTRLAEPGAVVAIAQDYAGRGRPKWWVFKPTRDWPEDPHYLLTQYTVEVYPSEASAYAAHPEVWAIDLDPNSL